MQSAVATGAKLERILLHRVGKAVGDYSLIKAGDRVAVALSGGKDSFGLLHLLWRLRQKSPVPFEVVALTIHNGSEHFQSDLLADATSPEQGIPFHLERTQIAAIVEEKLRPGTSLLLAVRAAAPRGALRGARSGWAATRSPWGTTWTTPPETLLMNLFFEGALKAMPPKLLAENGADHGHPAPRSTRPSPSWPTTPGAAASPSSTAGAGCAASKTRSARA